MAADLVLITPGFPASGGDSTCVPPLQEYLQALRAARPELAITVIATQYPYTSEAYDWRSIGVFPCNGRITGWRRPLAWMRARRAWERIGRDGGPVAVHSFWLGECAMLADRFSRASGARHVLTLMGQDARDKGGWWRRLRPPYAAVCLSERHAGQFKRMTGRAPEAIVPWGIGHTSQAPKAPYRDIDLLFVGSMIDVKRPTMFVDLVRRIRERRRVDAMMIGAGGASPILQEEGIAVSGEMARSAVLATMARSRVLVHTSAFESQGYVFDEALLNGMSIVSFEVGTAEASSRWRVAHDPEAMEREIHDLLDRPPPTEPLILHPVTDTVNAYLQLYGLA